MRVSKASMRVDESVSCEVCYDEVECYAITSGICEGMCGICEVFSPPAASTGMPCCLSIALS